MISIPLLLDRLVAAAVFLYLDDIVRSDAIGFRGPAPLVVLFGEDRQRRTVQVTVNELWIEETLRTHAGVRLSQRAMRIASGTLERRLALMCRAAAEQAWHMTSDPPSRLYGIGRHPQGEQLAATVLRLRTRPT